jgi:hypothetical protein
MKSSRWTSRKFLLTVAAQATAVAVLLWPGHESAIVQASQSVMSLLLLMLTAAGYVRAEAALDLKAMDAQAQTESGKTA